MRRARTDILKRTTTLLGDNARMAFFDNDTLPGIAPQSARISAV